MEDNKHNSKKRIDSNNDEIDLINLFSVLGNKISLSLKSVGNSILNIVLYLYRIVNKWKVLMALAIIVGGSVGFMSKNTSKFYKSKATVNSRFLRGVDFKAELSELNALCTEEGSFMLAKALNIPPETAELISEIITTGYFKLYKEKTIDDPVLADSLLLDSYDNETRFEIIVSSVDSTITKQVIQEGFEYYFNNNIYIQKNLKEYQKSLFIKEKSFYKEKEDLQDYNNAYKKIIHSQSEVMLQDNINQNHSKVIMMATDPQSDGYIKQSGELAFETMQKSRDADDSIALIRRRLSLLQPVEFVNRFSEFYTVSLSAKGKTALGMLIGFLCVVTFAILIDINSYLKSKTNS